MAAVKFVKIEPNNHVDQLLYKYCTSKWRPAWVEIGEMKTCLPIMYERVYQKIEDFEVKNEDLFVTGHPRSGTTWAQEMVWLVGNDCDFEGAKDFIEKRWPFLEGDSYFCEEILEKLTVICPEFDFFNSATQLKSRRFIKSHLPWDLLPNQIQNGAKKPKFFTMLGVKCVKIKPNNPTDKLLYKYATSKRRPAWAEIGESKTCLPLNYKDIAEEVDNFEIRNDDIYVISHPRTGTTWTQEMVWLVANDCNFKGAKSYIIERWPYLEGKALLSEEILDIMIKSAPAMDYINYAKKMESPRFIKSHLPWDLLPKEIRNGMKKPKIITTIRNPKDVCVSLFHLNKSLCEFSGSLEDYCELFLAGRGLYGLYWNQVFSYWNRRDEPNILVLQYEDMKKDMPKVLKSVARFLGKPLSETQIAALCEHLNFENIKNNMYVNCEVGLKYLRSLYGCEQTDYENFIRKGEVGGYKEEMSQEMIERFDKWIEEHTKGTGLHFE